jgi:hypothetical protein
MKSFKKIAAFALSAVMTVTMAMPAFAADPNNVEAGTSGADGNILAYNVDEVIVPTALAFAINPNGYTITQRDGDSTGSTAKVVSLNYGIVNESTNDKLVKISFDATYAADETKGQIEIVDAAEKAQPYDESSNPTGAQKGEYKIYLGIAAATAAPTTQADAAIDKDTSGLSDGTVLADVKMTAATAGVVPFAEKEAETGKKATAVIAFALDKAAYTLKNGETIDLTTTAAQLSSKLEMSAIGDVAGFTIVGDINPKADWSKAEAVKINITPVYEVKDASGDESAVASTHKQVEIPQPAIAVTTAGVITITNPGCAAAELVAGTCGNATTRYSFIGNRSTITDEVDGSIKIVLGSAWLSDWSGKEITVEVTLADGTKLTSSAVTFD